MKKLIDFCFVLEQQLKKPLPGFMAQQLMEPISRKLNIAKKENKSVPKKSAVLILLYPYKNEIYTVFIKRPYYNGVHSAQIAFPGGKKEENDFDLKATALREAFEETGIIENNVKVIGNLSLLYIPPSNFDVLPIIGYSLSKPSFVPDKKEVDKIIETPFFKLQDKSIIKEVIIKNRQGTKYNVPAYYINNEIIWGATAIIISELNQIVSKIINLPE